MRDASPPLATPTSIARRLAAVFAVAPAYPPSDADRRTARILGLELPLRATVAILVMLVVILFDFSRTAIPEEIQAIGRAAAAMRYQAIERLILFGLVPALVVVFAFRDRPTSYGLGIGSWRLGIALAMIGCLVMTPIIVAIGSNPEFAVYYQVSSAPVGYLVTTNLIDLLPSEFLMRGFVMFTLLRTIGPIGVVVAQLPFVFIHLGKPELELFSTLAGGLVFGWLDWRTRSIWWSGLGHVYIQTLVVAVAAAHV
jgi:membrane protease YdiL (CAAX protease family)